MRKTREARMFKESTPQKRKFRHMTTNSQHFNSIKSSSVYGEGFKEHLRAFEKPVTMFASSLKYLDPIDAQVTEQLKQIDLKITQT